MGLGLGLGVAVGVGDGVGLGEADDILKVVVFSPSLYLQFFFPSLFVPFSLDKFPAVTAHVASISRELVINNLYFICCPFIVNL